MRFTAVQGLRGWLAWAVFFNHVAFFADFRVAGRVMKHLGATSVLCFIIISGFVITHMLLENPKPYRVYITHRFMRLFPVFAVTCIIGYFVCQLPQNIDDAEFAVLTRNTVAAMNDYFWPHFFLHLTMLHGAISDNIIPFSELTFNMPAWSLSLEWQFYLIAPAVLWLAISRPLITALATLAVFALFRANVFGDAPASIAGLSAYFGAGIVSRAAYPMLAKSELQYVTAVFAALVILMMLRNNWPLAIWLAVYFGFALQLKGPAKRLYELALESRIATYFGARSYSTYLLHMPLIMACAALFAAPPNPIVLLAITVPATIAASEILYQLVEQPGIRLGRRITSSHPNHQGTQSGGAQAHPRHRDSGDWIARTRRDRI